MIPYLMSGPLFNSGKPNFFYDCSSTGGDIAVLSVKPTQDDPVLSNFGEIKHREWTVYAGLDAFVLGYASALSIGGTPIWRRVSIASEPSKNVDGRPIVLLDGLTYKGMSGGPVIAMQNIGFTRDKAYHIGREMEVRILGVYGGRYSIEPEKSGQLGYYWPMSIANQILSEKRQIGDLGD